VSLKLGDIVGCQNKSDPKSSWTGEVVEIKAGSGNQGSCIMQRAVIKFISNTRLDAKTGYFIYQKTDGFWYDSFDRSPGNQDSESIVKYANEKGKQPMTKPSQQVEGHTPQVVCVIGCAKFKWFGLKDRAAALRRALKSAPEGTQITFDGQQVTLKQVDDFLAWCKQEKI
jgi:hypothetical protein